MQSGRILASSALPLLSVTHARLDRRNCGWGQNLLRLLPRAKTETRLFARGKSRGRLCDIRFVTVARGAGKQSHGDFDQLRLEKH